MNLCLLSSPQHLLPLLPSFPAVCKLQTPGRVCRHISGAVWPTLCSWQGCGGCSRMVPLPELHSGLSVVPPKCRWGGSRGGLIRLLLFLNFCKSWSCLPGLKGCQAPCVWCWERWLCCYGTGGVSEPHCSGSWAGSQQHVLIAAVQQQNKYSEISIKAVIKGASLAF